MNQNIKLIIIIVVVLLTSFIYNKIRPEKKIVNLKKEIIYNDSSSDANKTSNKVNVNQGIPEDYLKVGVSLSLANKIVEYRNIVGKVENLDELSRIAGIGAKTLEKLSKNIEVGEGNKKNMLRINKSSTITLKYYGFTSKEIKKIESFIKENEVIFSNIELIEILGRERYREYEDIINYN